LSSIVFGAQISGKVYDIGLDEVYDVVVTINTVPAQTFVAKNGSYSFEVPKGEYVLTAKKISNNITTDFVQENITVESEGNYNLDLILFPVIDESGISDINLNYEVESETEKTSLSWLIIIIIIILILLIISYFLFRKKIKSDKNFAGEVNLDEANLSDKIFDEIKNSGGRITQKELRKKFPYSEAKISLVISELEAKGRIEKIKKGRGNIIILKR